jgi:hypothetical protein
MNWPEPIPVSDHPKPFTVVATREQMVVVANLQCTVNAEPWRGFAARAVTIQLSGVPLSDDRWELTITPRHVTATAIVLNADLAEKRFELLESADFSIIDALPSPTASTARR